MTVGWSSIWIKYDFRSVSGKVNTNCIDLESSRHPLGRKLDYPQRKKKENRKSRIEILKEMCEEHTHLSDINRAEGRVSSD